MPLRSIIIYCDESAAKGRYFSHFYGGALIEARRREAIEAHLQAVKERLHLGAELKWTKITAAYAGKYIEFVDAFFDLIEAKEIKVRIMFTQNSNHPVGLVEEQIEKRYFLLYYQMIKHAFGLAYCGVPRQVTRVALFLDDIPDKSSHYGVFRKYLSRLSRSNEFLSQRVVIEEQDITDVCSHDHLVLQGLDIILGAMQFRLNDLHKEKPSGEYRRSKRTVAKERVYKVINARIRRLYPGFNIGANTGIGNDLANRWHHPYRHWLFVPTLHMRVVGAGKRKK